MLKCRSAFRTGVAGVYRGRGGREEGKVRQRDEGGEKAAVSGRVVSLIISSFRSSSHSFLLMMHTGHSAPPLHSEKTDRDTGPLWAAPRVRTQSSRRPPCWRRTPAANCRNRGCWDTACMACELSRVGCRGTAPLCNREVQAPWALSGIRDLIFQDGSRGWAEPAADSLHEEGL